MKINFENKTVGCYREVCHQKRIIQESCETVVPDINDDIGKIASVQSSVYLKSKDLSGRGVLISGEAQAAIVYITENEKSVSYVKISRPFSLEYEIQGMDGEILPQIRLDIHNTEARIINPRKISVTFEICGELNCYKHIDIPIDTLAAAEASNFIHSKFDTADIVTVNAVNEKTFTLSEQLIFPGGKPAPSQIVMLKADFCLNDSQNVGSKLIIKGNLNLYGCYLSDEVNYPVKVEFSCPFSQIVDMGVDELDCFSTVVEISSVYYDIINTINGEKALDTEVHAVLQISSRRKNKVRYISDVYSNLMPCECAIKNQSYLKQSSAQQMKLAADERISVVEDCTDVLSVFSGMSQLNVQGEKIALCINLDIVYRTKNGSLSAVRRTVSLSGECSLAPDRIIDAALTDIYLRPDGAYIDVHAAVDIKYECSRETEISCVLSVELDEEKAYDFNSFPAIFLVRAEKEDLWTIAKNYHSSVEKISALNSVEDGTEGKMLLISRSI